MRGVAEVANAVERHEAITGRFGTHSIFQKPVVDEVIEPVQAKADQIRIGKTKADKARGRAVGSALVVEVGIREEKGSAFTKEIVLNLLTDSWGVHRTTVGFRTAREVVGDGDIGNEGAFHAHSGGASSHPVAHVQFAVRSVWRHHQFRFGQIQDISRGDLRGRIRKLAVSGVNHVTGIDLGESQQDVPGLFGVADLLCQDMGYGALTGDARHILAFAGADIGGPGGDKGKPDEVPVFARVVRDFLPPSEVGLEYHVFGVVGMGIDGLAGRTDQLIGILRYPFVVSVNRGRLAGGAHGKEFAAGGFRWNPVFEVLDGRVPHLFD